MADGEIVIETNIDIKNAEKALRKLEEQAESLRTKIEQKTAQKSAIEAQLNEATAAAEKTREKIQQLKAEMAQTQTNLRTEDLTADQRKEQLNDLRRITSEIDQQQRTLNGQEGTVSRLREREKAVTDELTRQNQALTKNTEESGELSKKIEKAGGVGATLRERFEGTAQSVEKLNKRFATLVKRVFVFSVALKALNALKDWFGDVVNANDELSGKLAELKGAFLTAAQPILNVLIPALTKLVDVLTTVVSAAAAVIAMLFDTSTEAAADQAESLEKEAEAIDGVGESAKTASKQLASFDTINKLSGKTSAAASNSTGIQTDYGKVKQYKLPAWLENLVSVLKIGIDDVLFDWDNLTAEDIAKKVVGGLVTLCAGVAGFAIGGVPGAIVGVLTGLVISGMINKLTFDNDGKLSKTEIAKLVVYALGALVGGAIGFMVGGVTGALIGATIGIALTLLVESMRMKKQQEALNRWLATDAGQFQQELEERIENSTSLVLDLKARISSITGEVDANTLANFGLARDLIEEIFALDAKDNKTAAEIERIQSLITGLNSLGLGDFNLTWDDATGHVQGTKEEILAALEAQYKMIVLQTKMQAAANLEAALTEAQTQLEQAKADVDAAQQAYDSAVKNAHHGGKFGLSFLEQAEYYREQNAAIEQMAKDLEAAKKAESDLTEIVANTKTQINSLREEIGLPLAETEKEVVASGHKIMSGFGRGMQSATASTSTASIASAVTVTDAVKEAWSEAGLETTAYEQGVTMGEAFANGLTSKEPTMRSTLSGAMSGLLSIAKNAVAKINSALTGINATIEVSTSVANGAIASAMNVAKIPHLAEGRVIPANHEFLAVLGDQKSGTNIETPLSTMVEAFRIAMAGQKSESAQGEAYMVVDDEVFAKLVYRLNKVEQRRVGVTLSEGL